MTTGLESMYQEATAFDLEDCKLLNGKLYKGYCAVLTAGNQEIFIDREMRQYNVPIPDVNMANDKDYVQHTVNLANTVNYPHLSTRLVHITITYQESPTMPT